MTQAFKIIFYDNDEHYLFIKFEISQIIKLPFQAKMNIPTYKMADTVKSAIGQCIFFCEFVNKNI